jgi:hypothetical protein
MTISEISEKYIKKEVSEIFNSHITEEEKVFNEFVKKMKAEVRSINKECRALIEKRAQEFNETYNLTNKAGINFNPKKTFCECNEYMTERRTEIGKKSDKAERERQKKIDKTVEDIILTLELGGTKEDLDRMLNELREKISKS